MTVHITCTIIGTNTVIGEVCRALKVGGGGWHMTLVSLPSKTLLNMQQHRVLIFSCMKLFLTNWALIAHDMPALQTTCNLFHSALRQLSLLLTLH